MDKWSLPASESFLEELRERARRYGWQGDYVEVRRFVEDLHDDAKIKLPSEMYDVIEEEDE